MSINVSLTMIVKDESATLGRCLASVQEIVDEIIIVDTGSTDNTKDIAKNYHAQVFDLPWTDSFAIARNESLSRANGKWILWLDADEFLDVLNRERFKSLFSRLPAENRAYVATQRSLFSNGPSGVRVQQVRLFRNHPALCWKYRVHEQIQPSLYQIGYTFHWTDIIINHTGYQGAGRCADKLKRNLRLLHLEQSEHPYEPFVLFNLSLAYYQLGRLADVLPLLLSSLQSLQPGDSIRPKVYALLGRVYMRLDKHSQALSLCREGRMYYPDDLELLFLDGQLQLHGGDEASAETCWRRLLFSDYKQRSAWGEDGVTTGHPVDIDESLFHSARHHLALLCFNQRRHSEAENLWRAVTTESPAFLPAWQGLSALYLFQKRWEDLEQASAHLEDDPQGAMDAAVLRARAGLARGEFATARFLLHNVIAQSPQAVPPRLYLTHVLLQEGRDPAAAEQALRKLLALDPSLGEAWHNLAKLMHRQGRLAEAITVCQSARVYLPNSPDLLLLLGVLQHQAGDLVNAETTLRQLAEQKASPTPGSSSEVTTSEESVGHALRRQVAARHNLALIYRRNRRFAEAESQWRAALAAMPELDAAWVGLGELCLMEGRLSEVEYILARLEGSPQGADAAVLLRVRWHWQRRQYADARRLLERIIASHPTASEPRRLLSYVLLEEGRDPAAAECALHELLAVAPHDAEARHNLGVLHSNQRRSSLSHA